MIIIQDWVAAIPAEEKHIAYVGEGMAETRTFFVTGTDWERYKEWSFHLDLAFDLSSVTAVDRRQVEQTKVDSTETVTESQVVTSATTTKEHYVTEQKQVNWEPATDIVSLDKSVEAEGIRLTWTVLRQHTHLPGRLLATLRAVGSTFAQVKKSALMVFEVEPAVEASPAVVLPTSEFEEMESRMDTLLEQTRQAAEEASEQVLAAYGHAGDAATKARAAVIGKYRTGVASHKVAVRTDLYEIRATKMPCLYDELFFHDNTEDCQWFHSGGMEQMAEETARALCELLEVTYTAPKTESPTIPQPPRAGDAVVLRKEKLYRSSIGEAAVVRTGTFYLYDGKKVNGRYRVTNQKARVGKQPLALYVSGWVEL